MLPYDPIYVVCNPIYIHVYKFKLKLNVFSTLFDIPKFRVQLAFIREQRASIPHTIYEPNDSKLNEKPFGKKNSIQTHHRSHANTAQVRIELFALQIS